MQGSELKAIRKSLGMTLAELGEAIGMSGRFVGDMERGRAAIERRTEMAVRYLALTAQSDNAKA